MQPKPQNLDEAMALPNGPIAKFYMLKFAAHLVDPTELQKVGCDEIRAIIAAARGK